MENNHKLVLVFPSAVIVMRSRNGPITTHRSPVQPTPRLIDVLSELLSSLLVLEPLGVKHQAPVRSAYGSYNNLDFCQQDPVVSAEFGISVDAVVLSEPPTGRNRHFSTRSISG